MIVPRSAAIAAAITRRGIHDRGMPGKPHDSEKVPDFTTFYSAGGNHLAATCVEISMKKVLFSFLFASLFATTLTLAQTSGTAPTPADIAQRRVDFLTRQLTLTTAQQQQALTI